MDPYRIMIVDHGGDIGESLRDYLSMFGYDVRVCTDGATAVASICLEHDRSPFHLVLLDLHMLGMNGMDVLRELQHRHQAIPIIIMSATATMEMFWAGIRAGAVDFLKKPIDYNELHRKCQVALLTDVPGSLRMMM